MMKKRYEIPSMDVEVFASTDIICASGGDNSFSKNPYDKDGDGFVDGWY